MKQYVQIFHKYFNTNKLKLSDGNISDENYEQYPIPGWGLVEKLIS